MLPMIDIDYDRLSGLLVRDGYLYIVKNKGETIDELDYIRVVDLGSNLEVKRHTLR